MRRFLLSPLIAMLLTLLATPSSPRTVWGRLGPLANTLERSPAGKGKVAIIQGQLGTTPEQDRDKGFNEALAKFPDLKVVAKQPSNAWMQDEGFAIGQDMLQRYPDITVFFGRADALALGAAQAAKVANLSDKIIVVGFDGDVAGLKAVESGTLESDDDPKDSGDGQASTGKRARPR